MFFCERCDFEVFGGTLSVDPTGLRRGAQLWIGVDGEGAAFRDVASAILDIFVDDDTFLVDIDLFRLFGF